MGHGRSVRRGLGDVTVGTLGAAVYRARRRRLVSSNPLQPIDQVVLAIDPGSLKLGWAVVRSRQGRLERLASGTLKLNPRDNLPTRLGGILKGIQALLEGHPVDALAIEAAFVHDNPHTALVLGQARGVPIALAASRGLPVFEYPPALVKRAIVGSGRAVKEQVQRLVQMTLGLSELPQEDEADALAVAVTHLRRAQSDALVPSAAALALAPEAAMTPGRNAYLQAVQSAAALGKKKGGGWR